MDTISLNEMMLSPPIDSTGSDPTDSLEPMLGSLKRTMRAYGLLELRVSALLAGQFVSGCAACGGRCCEVDICRESLESDWLRLLSSSSGEKGAAFDPISGWRSPAGCRLPIGRPPICYAFFCKPVIESLPSDNYRENLLAASTLVPAVGERALGRRHLVTLSAADIFGRLDTRRLRGRILAALSRVAEIAADIGAAAPGRSVPAQPKTETPILLVDVVEEIESDLRSGY